MFDILYLLAELGYFWKVYVCVCMCVWVCVCVCVCVCVFVCACMRASGWSIRKKGRCDDLEIRVLDFQSTGLRLNITGWFQGRLSEYQEFPGCFMVKSKLSPSTDSVALRQLNHIHKNRS